MSTLHDAILKEWTRVSSQHLTVPSAGPSFFGRIFHPAFNVDLDDAEDTINTFETHARAVGKSVQSLRSVFGKAREARIGKSVSCQQFLIRNLKFHLKRCPKPRDYSLTHFYPLSLLNHSHQSQPSGLHKKRKVFRPVRSFTIKSDG